MCVHDQVSLSLSLSPPLSRFLIYCFFSNSHTTTYIHTSSDTDSDNDDDHRGKTVAAFMTPTVIAIRVVDAITQL